MEITLYQDNQQNDRRVSKDFSHEELQRLSVGLPALRHAVDELGVHISRTYKNIVADPATQTVYIPQNYFDKLTRIEKTACMARYLHLLCTYQTLDADWKVHSKKLNRTGQKLCYTGLAGTIVTAALQSPIGLTVSNIMTFAGIYCIKRYDIAHKRITDSLFDADKHAMDVTQDPQSAVSSLRKEETSMNFVFNLHQRTYVMESYAADYTYNQSPLIA